MWAGPVSRAVSKTATSAAVSAAVSPTGPTGVADDESQARREPGTVLVPPLASQVSRIGEQQDRGITPIAERFGMQIDATPP